MITHEKLDELRQLKEQLADIKEREMALRREIADELTDPSDAGTKRFELDGFNVKVVRTMSYKLDQTEIQMLLDRGLLPPDQQDLLRTKYELRLADYKKAYDTEVLDDAVIVTPAAPTVDIEFA